MDWPGREPGLQRWEAGDWRSEPWHGLDQCYWNCGPRRSADGFEKKYIANIVSDTNRTKDYTKNVCAKTHFVSWPWTESRRISSFHYFLPFNNYFIKWFKLVCRPNKRGYSKFIYRYNIFRIYLHALFGVGNFTNVIRMRTDGVRSDPGLPKSEKHWPR
jgi:hypothetical protein